MRGTNSGELTARWQPGTGNMKDIRCSSPSSCLPFAFDHLRTMSTALLEELEEHHYNVACGWKTAVLRLKMTKTTNPAGGGRRLASSLRPCPRGGGSSSRGEEKRRNELIDEANYGNVGHKSQELLYGRYELDTRHTTMNVSCHPL